MDVNDVKEILGKIKSEHGDDETQHDLEDDLFKSFVSSIADGTFNGDLAEGAREVLKSCEIKFCRWTS